MKRIKIVIGFLIIYGAGSEYVDASRQLGTPFSPGIMVGVFLMVAFSIWLIASAFSKRKYHLKPMHVIITTLVSIVTFAIVVLFSLSSEVTPRHFILVNGIRVPLGKCIDGNVRIIPDLKERETFCECFVEKIINDPELKLKYQGQLEHNKIDKVFNEIETNPKFSELGIENCITSVKIEWTDELAHGMKKSWIKELSETEFEEYNDVNKYCDCILEEYRKYPFEKVMEDGFNESKLAKEIDDKCTGLSIRN